MFVDVSAKPGQQHRRAARGGPPDRRRLARPAGQPGAGRPGSRDRGAPRPRSRSGRPPCSSSAARCASVTRSSPARPTAASAPCSTSTARTSTRPARRARSRCSASRSVPRAGDTFLVVDGRPHGPPDRRAARGARASGRAGQAPASASRSRTSTRPSQQARSRPAQPHPQGRRVRLGRGARGRAAQDRRRRRGRPAGHRPRCRCDHRDQHQPRDGLDAVIIGFNVRAEGQNADYADREGVEIRYYSVIYQAIEEIEAALKGMLKPEYEEVELGTAEIREIFRSCKFGNIAGSIVRSGEIKRRNAKARIIRDGVVVAENLEVAACVASRTTPPRSARASSAVSTWGRSTTSSSATSSRPTRCARSRAPELGCTHTTAPAPTGVGAVAVRRNHPTCGRTEPGNAARPRPATRVNTTSARLDRSGRTTHESRGSHG